MRARLAIKTVAGTAMATYAAMVWTDSSGIANPEALRWGCLSSVWPRLYDLGAADVLPSSVSAHSESRSAYASAGTRTQSLVNRNTHSSRQIATNAPAPTSASSSSPVDWRTRWSRTPQTMLTSEAVMPTSRSPSRAIADIHEAGHVFAIGCCRQASAVKSTAYL